MSHKGYAMESEIEDFFLRLTNQTKEDPILKTDSSGLIKLNRSFRVPTSGAMDSMSGDIITAISWLPKQLKVECKTRRQKTKKDGRIFVLELDWVRKNNREADIDHQMPVLVFAFKGDTSGNRLWWLMRVNDWHDLRARSSDPRNLRIPKCPGLVLNKKQDRLKIIHSQLSELSTIGDMGELAIDHLFYYLIPHSEFHVLMESLRV